MSDQERNDEYEDICMLCKRPESVAGKMFKLYQNACICSDCMHMTMDTMSQMDYMQGFPPMYGMMPNMNMEKANEEDVEAVDVEDEKPEDSPKEDGEKKKKAESNPFSGFHNIGFINLSDFILINSKSIVIFNLLLTLNLRLLSFHLTTFISYEIIVTNCRLIRHWLNKE